MSDSSFKNLLSDLFSVVRLSSIPFFVTHTAPTMMSDHFPYNVSRALEICTDAYAVEDQASSLHECGTQILDLSKKES